MSRRKYNLRRRQEREARRRKKMAARQRRNTTRQANQHTPKIRAGNQGASIAPTDHFHVRTHRSLHWVLIAIYVLLGAFFLLTGSHDPRVIGCAYCAFGAIHARLLKTGGVL
jgi:hypothetical protein